jgi:uncharacterized protein with PIN domain
MEDSEITEEWDCGDCGHTEEAPIDEVTGETVKQTVGSGRREKEVEIVVCPECKSEDWHSESVRDALLGGSTEEDA